MAEIQAKDVRPGKKEGFDHFDGRRLKIDGEGKEMSTTVIDAGKGKEMSKTVFDALQLHEGRKRWKMTAAHTTHHRLSTRTAGPSVASCFVRLRHRWANLGMAATDVC